MLERILIERPLPDIVPGLVVYETQNFQVVTDYKPGLEGTKEGERFFIHPIREPGLRILLQASMAHNIFNFNLRPVWPHYIEGEYFVYPCLRADYIPENIPALFQGIVEIHKPGEDTIPSPDRMERCISLAPSLHSELRYTFADDLPSESGIENKWTRWVRLLQTTHSDEIPPKIIHSHDPNPFYKVRKGWWVSLFACLENGLEYQEWTDSELTQEINAFVESYRARGFFFSSHLTTADDIEGANNLANLIWERYKSIPQGVLV